MLISNDFNGVSFNLPYLSIKKPKWKHLGFKLLISQLKTGFVIVCEGLLTQECASQLPWLVNNFFHFIALFLKSIKRQKTLLNTNYDIL